MCCPRPYRGIIPAHAGCTEGDECRRAHLPDHPRSRGVHFVVVCWLVGRWGSSPLTRGARGEHRGVVPLTRIIPAHAGCTGPHGRCSAPPSDHPRSRGVHEVLRLLPTPGRGSSPLTRGARHRHRPRHHPGRIIPAHAGCTPGGGGGLAWVADHPRSRGVHTVKMTPRSTLRGSSPLTRGARDPRARLGPGGRIIPAHAGCTGPRSAGTRCWPDHPRSRGVHGHWVPPR